LALRVFAVVVVFELEVGARAFVVDNEMIEFVQTWVEVAVIVVVVVANDSFC
jgi:hypothetical protein